MFSSELSLYRSGGLSLNNKKEKTRLTRAAMLLLRIGELLWVTGHYLPGGAKQSLGLDYGCNRVGALRATQRVHHARPKRIPFF